MDPVATNTSLHGLVNGVTPNEGMNVGKALPVVRLIFGEHIQEYPFKMKCQAVLLVWFKNSYHD